MKHKIILLITVISVMFWNTGCELDVAPADAINTSSLLNTSDGLLNVTNGCYALFKDNIEFGGYVDQNNNYLRQYYQMADFASDDITCGQVTEDPLFYSFTLTHSPDQANSRFFWYISYKIINSTNTVIDLTKETASPDEATSQLIGENYFLRAFVHFNLLRFYAKPYSVAPDAPGIILRESPTEPSAKARATVREGYNMVIADLKKSAELMNASRGPQYASKEAAYALLSRVYLYMDDSENTVAYANKVIESGKFELESSEGFKTYFPNAATSPETIMLVAFTAADNKGKFGSIASMLFSDGNSGWGEEFASSSLRDEMSAHPEDVRWNYIRMLDDGTGIPALKNGIETYYITKFSYQDGDPNLSSPVMLRYAEMYLNRAEAYAKSGKTDEALADVDLLRSHRGLENALYNGVLPANATALDVVLKERRIEFAFEGHRALDMHRNKRNIDRSYWGYHLPGLVVTDIDLTQKPAGYSNMVINWENPRTIYYVPVDEMLANPLCTQNP